jgi:hypothetical protein
LGGGAFGNKMDWIMDALERAIRLFSDSGLEIVFVNRGPARAEINEIAKRLSEN